MVNIKVICFSSNRQENTQFWSCKFISVWFWTLIFHTLIFFSLQKKDEDSYFRYVHLFVEYFSRSHSDDPNLEISQLPASLLKELSEYLKNLTYNKLSGLSSKQRTHNIIAVRCLSTLARYNLYQDRQQLGIACALLQFYDFYLC